MRFTNAEQWLTVCLLLFVPSVFLCLFYFVFCRYLLIDW